MKLEKLPLRNVEGSREVETSGLRGGQRFASADRVAEEVPVAMEFNGISHAVMLATPCDLEDFALGFALSEVIIISPADLYSVEVIESEQGLTVRQEISTECFARLKQYRRNLAGRTGCGLCGTESLNQALRPVQRVDHDFHVDAAAIGHALQLIRAPQLLHQATGAVHAAAWCDAAGEISMLREDVGRHNALDKLIGALAGKGIATDKGFALVTSRASYEMVQKAATAGMSILVAISAPTALAIDMAINANMALVGFARERDIVVYAHPERIDFDT
ncbi:MAG: formate dehydrogenase accessory sulfurtransferase FdhD [Verrucomicrobia bacterium]|nr:MAG: formate dehydrogenase accessory sulfurtransferase FdhD [Verrucomicrobiota bacterium]